MFKKITTILVLGAVLLSGCSADKYAPGTLTSDQKETVEDRLGSIYEALKTDNESFNNVLSSDASQYGDTISPSNECLMGLDQIDFSLPNPYTEEYDGLRINADAVKPYIYSTLSGLECTYSDPVSTGNTGYTFTVTVTGMIKDYDAAWNAFLADPDAVAGLIRTLQTDSASAEAQFGEDFALLLDNTESVPYTATAVCDLSPDGTVSIRTLSDAPLDGTFSLSANDRNVLLETLGIYDLDYIYEVDPDSLQGAFSEEEWEHITSG